MLPILGKTWQPMFHFLFLFLHSYAPYQSSSPQKGLVLLLPDVLFASRPLDGLRSPPLLLLRHIVLKQAEKGWLPLPPAPWDAIEEVVRYLEVRVRLPVVPLLRHLHVHTVTHSRPPHLEKKPTMSQRENAAKLWPKSEIVNELLDIWWNVLEWSSVFLVRIYPTYSNKINIHNMKERQLMKLKLYHFRAKNVALQCILMT